MAQISTKAFFVVLLFAIIFLINHQAEASAGGDDFSSAANDDDDDDDGDDIDVVISNVNQNSNENRVAAGNPSVENNNPSAKQQTTASSTVAPSTIANQPTTIASSTTLPAPTSTTTAGPDYSNEPNATLCYDLTTISCSTNCSSDAEHAPLFAFPSSRHSSGMQSCLDFMASNVTCQDIYMTTIGSSVVPGVDITTDADTRLIISANNTPYAHPTIVPNTTISLYTDFNWVTMFDFWIPGGQTYYLVMSVNVVQFYHVCIAKLQVGTFPVCESMDNSAGLLFENYYQGTCKSPVPAGKTTVLIDTVVATSGPTAFADCAVNFVPTTNNQPGVKRTGGGPIGGLTDGDTIYCRFIAPQPPVALNITYS